MARVSFPPLSPTLCWQLLLESITRSPPKDAGFVPEFTAQLQERPLLQPACSLLPASFLLTSGWC